jgi:cell division protein FtsI (penicillin-binding protein 3)
MSEARPTLVPPVRMPDEASRAAQMTRLRLMFVGLVASLWCLVVAGRLVQLQVLDRSFFEKRAARQSERTINLDPRRGPILDRNGRPLAVSVDAESIYAVPQDVERPAQTAAALGKALGLDAAERRDVLEQLRKTRGFVWIKRKVDPARARAVREAQLEGVGLLTENRRYYPKRELAAQVLGYVGIDNAGMSGIEYALDKDIRGHAAKVVVETDARRRPLSHVEKPSTDGAAVTLTIDEAIQYVAETELDKSMAETKALSGMVVVMDPNTGEILALANRPTFNPNRFGDFTSARWRNRAVADVYEPGSIFKIVAAAGGLQEKVADPEEIIDCGDGHIDIGGVRINDHRVFHHLSFRDVIAESSDVGTIRIAQRLGRETFNRYMRDFGFGVPTGIELPGESPGLLKPLARWGTLSLATMSFGQEMAVTGVQMAAATAVVANGGRLLKPQIIHRVEDKDGRTVRETRPIVVRQVLEPRTASILTGMLVRVVTDGTGKRAAIEGYAVAGKTGTAQKIDPKINRYSATDHVASFVGFVPVSQPALVVVATLDTPRGAHHGGEVAAPLFARVAEGALRRLAIPPDDPTRRMRVVAPTELREASYRPEAVVPVPPPAVGLGEPSLMPDLRGLAARDAALTAARLGLIVRLKGTGRVSYQIPEPGTEVEAGASCSLVLSPERDGGEQGEGR